MLKNYLKIAWRNIIRNKSLTTVNVLGLSIGFTTCLLILGYVQYQKSFDSFHPNRSNIYRIDYAVSVEGKTHTNFASSPPRIAPFLTEKLPEVETFTRIHPYGSLGGGSLTMQANGSIYRESGVYFTDSGFFKVFTFPLLRGNKNTCLNDLRTMVITESTSKKYFGTSDPMGQQVFIDNAKEPYIITGIAKDPPKNSTLQFDFLISYQTINWWYEGEAEDSWYAHNYHSYIVLKPGTNVKELENKLMDTFLSERGSINDEFQTKQLFTLEALNEIHHQSQLGGEIDPSRQVNLTTLRVLSFAGWIVLLIAWINYVNLSMAHGLSRIKEIEVRKAIGALKRQLIIQLSVESLAVQLLSISLSSAIILLTQNIISQSLGISIPNPFHLVVPSFLAALFLVLAGTIGVSMYPALLLASVNPIGIFKRGLVAIDKPERLQKVLVVFQFTISLLLIIGAIIIHQQIQFISNKNPGFDPNYKLVIRGPNMLDGQDSLFYNWHGRVLDELSKYPQVKSVSVSSGVPGEKLNDLVFVRKKADMATAVQSFFIQSIGYNYFSTLGIKLLAGRSYNEKMSNNNPSGVILNKTAVQQLGYVDPKSILEEYVVINHKYPEQVIGVVDDFHQISPKEKISPMIFHFDSDFADYYVVDFDKDYQLILAKISDMFSAMFPQDVFEYFFLDDQYQRQFISENNLRKTLSLFSILAFYVAFTGLFALSSFSVSKRLKEIGIRKVLGSNVLEVTRLLTIEFTKLILIAILIAAPMSYLAASRWIETFAYRIDLSWWYFSGAGLATLLVALLTVGLQTFRAARVNPAKILRTE